MKLRTHEMTPSEYDALVRMVVKALAGVRYDNRRGTNIVALSDDFLPTNGIREVRWLFCDSGDALALVRVDGDGGMTQVTRGGNNA